MRTKRIGWNSYRCPSCAARMWPERLYHRLCLWWNPFGKNPRPIRYLFKVHRETVYKQRRGRRIPLRFGG